MDNNATIAFDFVISKIINVAERLPNPKWTLQPLDDNIHYVLGMSLEGEAVYCFEHTEYTIKKGDVLFFPDGYIRSAESSKTDPWHFITVTFDAIFFSEDARDSLKDMPRIIRQVPNKLIEKFLKLNNFWTGKNLAYILKSRCLIQEIVYDLIMINNESQYNPLHYQRIEAIRQYIQDNYWENFSVEELANKANFSPSYFRSLFKNITGMTTVQYSTLVKINKAKDFLSAGETNVSEAATRTGFKDIFYFSRQFKKITNHSPSYYSKHVKNKVYADEF